ncbi:hypothetical protein WG70_24890 [Burkholderia oklahomensis EO147]|nr:hypothetical protein [Burkholderia oklahomensis]AOI42791.1 hypothetical protein WG70_24890 [Burkholderia oklahomensis EO147]AOI46284.1 hypothetical protein WI23_11100 [Burkholderia oklahomensis C6786]KUY54533.1 hypothetical protein WG70_12705 [Burkholderia oklahomensis EO147]MBI0361131.1 hypothetical protein [Burkholderia oklahomensis]QPS39048.1 hypothetical protein I6G57_01205 [Burkholderia oklahomensis]
MKRGECTVYGQSIAGAIAETPPRPLDTGKWHDFGIIPRGDDSGTAYGGRFCVLENMAGRVRIAPPSGGRRSVLVVSAKPSNICTLNGLSMNLGTDVFRFLSRTARLRSHALEPAFVHATSMHSYATRDERRDRRSVRTSAASAAGKTNARACIAGRSARRTATSRRAASRHPNPAAHAFACRAH